MELITLKNLSELTPIQCPSRGNVNFPCVICKECEIGNVEITFGDHYLVENTVNSILIHINMDIQPDPLEKVALNLVKNDFSKKIPAIQRGDWEEGDIAIMITNDMIADSGMIQNLVKFIHDFPKQWRQISIDAKRQMNKWSATQVNQLSHRYFRGV
ncbi:MAG: hypothetical protein OEY49_01005 [Candidatus Heimdallarchaeota archaeon]|nr:hypothetical protein [Candidatus Heimdallarchaeota archaeon]